ncbi:NUDIX hydrolase [Asanoa iriomotensis]|nr:NUDIX domain-containing protein [Asanoa iriomotensis]
MIDIFDGNHQPIGTFERVAAHKQGLWHHTFHCWIVGRAPAESEGFVVLQLRSPSKKNYPNMLDITAAGHLEAGETPEDGVREIEEELGVAVESGSLLYLGIKHDVMDENNGVRNREFSHVYLLRDDRPIDQYRLSEEEVSGLVRISIADGLALFSGEKGSVSCQAIRADSGGTANFEREVHVEDLIPRVDSYYLKIFAIADLHLKGYKYLSI